MGATPEPVYMTGDDGQVLATASVHRPPGRRELQWSWRMSAYDDAGKRCWHPLGRYDEADVPNALLELFSRLYPGRVRSDGSAIRTLDALLEAWAAWVEERPDISPYTRRAYLQFAKRVAPYTRSVALDALSRDRYRQIREAVERDGVARSTVNHCMLVLNQAMIWGREKDLPIPAIRTRGLTRRLVRDRDRVNNHSTPSDEDVSAVLASMRSTPAKLALYVIWITGCRVGDLIGWTPDDLRVDEQGQAWVMFRRRKNGNEGGFPITQQEYEHVLALVPARFARGQVIFTEHFRKNASGTWAAACVRAGVPVFSPHGVRRLMDDKMCRRGVELKTYEILMDHSAETALRNYRRATRDDLVAALPKLRSSGDPLSRWLAQRGMTEDDALSLLREAVGDRPAAPALRVVPS